MMVWLITKSVTGNANRGSFRRLSGASGQHLRISCDGRMLPLNASTIVFLSSRTTSARSITFLLMSSANCAAQATHTRTRWAGGRATRVLCDYALIVCTSFYVVALLGLYGGLAEFVFLLDAANYNTFNSSLYRFFPRAFEDIMSRTMLLKAFFNLTKCLKCF